MKLYTLVTHLAIRKSEKFRYIIYKIDNIMLRLSKLSGQPPSKSLYNS